MSRIPYNFDLALISYECEGYPCWGLGKVFSDGSFEIVIKGFDLDSILVVFKRQVSLMCDKDYHGLV